MKVCFGVWVVFLCVVLVGVVVKEEEEVEEEEGGGGGGDRRGEDGGGVGLELSGGVSCLGCCCEFVCWVFILELYFVVFSFVCVCVFVGSVLGLFFE